VKHSRPPNVSSGVEPPPKAIPDVDASPVRAHPASGADAFVVSAYEAHHAELFAFLARATRDTMAAEELLQQTYLRLATEARAGRAPIELRGWLFRVASNLFIRRAQRQTTASSPEARVVGQEGVAEMERVLAGLSPDARLALLLSGAGFAGEEIATTIGRSVAATRTLLARARARVRVRRGLYAADAP
jgi:RNA polymerase sigma factor (sigma-70 family)